MNIEKTPDISHFSSEDIIKIMGQSTRGQIEVQTEALNLMIAKLDDVAKIDTVNIRKVSELMIAAKESGSCGGGIVCGC